VDVVFDDPAVQPTPALIQDALGPAVEVWHSLCHELKDDGVAAGWRFYSDGGWLAKAALHGKTVFWTQVDHGFARVTFYFAERHRNVLAEAMDLPESLRQQVAGQRMTGKLLPVSLHLQTATDVEVIKAVMGYKLSLK